MIAIVQCTLIVAFWMILVAVIIIQRRKRKMLQKENVMVYQYARILRAIKKVDDLNKIHEADKLIADYGREFSDRPDNNVDHLIETLQYKIIQYAARK